MQKSRTVKQKVIGRPRTGITPLMGFRADPATRARIVRWAENQPDMPSLSEAIRRLVELGLTVKSKGRPKRGESKQRAHDLAGVAIDEMSDTTASPEDQAIRKRRPLKGPSVFRFVRLDQEK
jgi:hypothetical protein